MIHLLRINQTFRMRGISPARDQRGCSRPLDFPFNSARSKLWGIIRFKVAPLKKAREGRFALARKNKSPSISLLQRGMPQLAALIGCAAFLHCTQVVVWAQSDFYRGKTITFIVNMAAGDANDLWARTLARS